MKLSLVTSYYNCSKYIKEQSASILSQDYQNWEWIIADDFSTDDTKEKLQELAKKDSRIKLVELDHKKQLWWNPQLFASGDIVCPIDGDDAILPGALKKIKFYFETFPEAVFLHFNANKYREILPQNASQFSQSFIDNVYIANDNDSFLNGLKKKYSKKDGIFGYLRVFRNIKDLYFKEHEDAEICSSNDGQWILRLEELGKTLAIPRTAYLARQIFDSENFRNWNIRGECRLMSEAEARRKNLYLPNPRKINFFDDIYDLAESLYITPLNWEKTKKKISFLNFNYDSIKKEKAKILFFDHEIIFDEKDADYAILKINVFDDPQYIIEMAKIISHNKNFIIFCDSCELQKSNKNATDNMAIIQNKLSEMVPFWFLYQQNRSYFIKLA